MSANSEDRRYVVSNLGFSYGVHDTHDPQEYAHPAGRDKQHISTNRLNSEIVEVVPTLAQALRIARELNEKHEAQKKRAS